MQWFQNSRLFELAWQGKRLTHIAAVIPLSFIFAVVGQFGVVPLIAIMFLLYGGVSLEGLPVIVAGFWASMELVFSFILVYAILWAWLKFVEKRPFWTLGYEAKNALAQYGRGFVFGGLMFSGAVIVLALFGTLSFEQGDPSKQGFAALGGVILVLLGWIVQGGAEEVLIRGWVLPVIGARYKPWLGLLVSSLIFALLHGLNPGISILALINLALYGTFAGLYAMRDGSLWGISAIHSVWNWVQGNFFGFQVSGTEASGGTLINLLAKGPEWITGGAFGPEGGIGVTIVLVISIALVLFWKSKEEKVQEVIVQ